MVPFANYLGNERSNTVQKRTTLAFTTGLTPCIRWNGFVAAVDKARAVYEEPATPLFRFVPALAIIDMLDLVLFLYNRTTFNP